MQGLLFVLFCALLAACGSSSEETSSCANNNGGCDPHATCSEPNGGGVSCTCEAGYAGDGHTCTNVAGSLQGLRWELPCAGAASPVACNATDIVPIKSTLGGVPGTSGVLGLYRVRSASLLGRRVAGRTACVPHKAIAN